VSARAIQLLYVYFPAVYSPQFGPLLAVTTYTHKVTDKVTAFRWRADDRPFRPVFDSW